MPTDAEGGLLWQAASAAEDTGAKIPVVLLTGFLGSGKTTLLNRLLKEAEMADTAVIINEFGDVAIDHLLVESSIENAVVLQSGCICCTVRGDLVDTLVDLLNKKQNGDIPDFQRVFIETTGLADPSAIIRSLATERLISVDYRLHAVATTVDAVDLAQQLDSFQEVSHQIALADMLILTKTDLLFHGAAEAITARLKHMNPTARVLEIIHGNVSANAFFSAAPPLSSRSGSAFQPWMRAEGFDAGDKSAGVSIHSDAIQSCTISSERKITEENLVLWLSSVVSLRGADILRVKGLVAVHEADTPVVVHAVRHLLHPPLRLESWPSEDHTTRVVFITRGISAAGLQASFDAFLPQT